jgi:phosphoglycolate phosphatase
MTYDLLVFDLDGTLIDSAADISASLRRVLVRMGREPIPHERVVAAIGSGVRKLIERTTTPPIDPVMEAFLSEYSEHCLDQTRLYPGVAETLACLPGRKIVLTNKPEKMSKKIIEGLGLAPRFEAVFGGDSFPTRKPDAATFHRAAGKYERALLIGDSGVDMETARNAGVPAVAVTYGYFKPGELDGAAWKIDRFDQLLELLR